MPVTVQQLPDEPILMTTLFGQATYEDYLTMYAEIQKFREGNTGIMYRITDTTQVNEVAFAQVIETLKIASKGTVGSATDPNMRVVYVANRPTVLFGLNAMRQQQFGGIEIPVFKTLEDALAFVRHEISKLSDEKQ